MDTDIPAASVYRARIILRVYKGGRLIDRIEDPMAVPQVGQFYIHEDAGHKEKLFVTEVAMSPGDRFKSASYECHTVT